MISTTYRGETVYLLHYLADWTTRPQTRFRVEAEATRSLGGREARESFAHTLRGEHEFSIFLPHEDAAEFRVGLKRCVENNRRVLVPFWPAANEYYSTGGLVYVSPEGEIYTDPLGEDYISATGESAYLLTGVWLTFERDFSAWEVHETDSPAGFTPTATAIRVPLMLGILRKTTEPVAWTPRLMTAEIQFQDTATAAFALRPVDLTFTPGPTLPTGITPQIFPVEIDWSQEVKAGSVMVEVKRDQIGFARGEAETFYPQKAARTLDATFTEFSWVDVAKLVGFFHQRQGPVEAFWLRGALDECTLAADTSSGSATVTVTKAAELGDTNFVAFIPASGVPVLRKVNAVNLVANTITLDSTPGTLPAASTRIVALILARFRKATLDISFRTSGLARSSISFIEVPDEYTTPTGETMGATMGALPRKAYLFRFVRKYPGGTIIDRYTSYERTIVAAGEVFENKPIQHSELTDSLTPEKTRVKITAQEFSGNPLLLFMPNKLEGPLWVEILECTPDALGIAGTPKHRFHGKVTRPRPKGAVIECEVLHFLQQLERPCPGFMFQPTCNHEIFSPACGVSETTWTFSATVISVTGENMVIGSITRPGGLPTIDDGYFAFGRIWFGSGATYQAREILDASAISGGQVTLELDRAFDPAVGTVQLSPGCAGTKARCQAFGNYQRFGGFPFMPAGNPSLVRITQNVSSGGKK